MKEEKTPHFGFYSLKTLIPYFKEHRVILLVGFLFMVLQNYGLARVPLYVQKILDEITNLNRFDPVLSYVLMALLFTAVTGIAMYAMRKMIIGVSRKIEYGLRQSIHEKFLALDLSFYQKNETGDLMSRSTNDLNDVRTLLGPGVMYIPNSVVRLALFIPILTGLSGVLMLVISAVLAALIIIILIILPRLRPLFRAVQVYAAKINSRTWQVLSGINTIKLHTTEDIEIQRFEQLNRQYIRKNMQVVKIRGFMWPFFIFIFSVTEMLVLLVGGRQVIMGGMSLGELLQFNIMVGQLAFPILSLGWIMSMFQQGISAMGRINTILDEPVESHSRLVKLSGNNLNIEVKNLSYHYPGQQVPALQDINLIIPPGQHVGITGTIGSGKSTLINVLTRMLKSQRGMIFINGIDILDIDPESIYERVGIVAQQPFLFSRSLAENVALAYDDAEGHPDGGRIAGAVRTAGLEKDVASFPQGLDEIIGERGITLSGGQKQRAAIARALFRDSQAVILDDALSSVDAKTETEIIENLKGLGKNRTLIVISHRISPFKNADRVYVFDEGRIVEEGTHAGLMEKDGLYAKLARLQQMENSLLPLSRSSPETEKIIRDKPEQSTGGEK